MFEGGAWTWDTYYTYGKSESETFVRDWESDNRLAMALDSVIDPISGDPVCRIDSSDPSYTEWLWDEVPGSGTILPFVRPDIQEKFVTFYTVALAEDFPDATPAQLEQEARDFFTALRP